MTEPAPLPHTLQWAVRLLLGEAVALGLLTTFLGYEGLRGAATSVRAALLITAYSLVMTAVLAFLGVNLARRRRWTRGPAIALHLLALPIAYYLVTGGLAWLGGLIGAIAVTVIGLLVSAPTR
ncbi:MAG TPA: hypothetical protein VFE14_13555, partial [Micromonosporaceae bacterium]|nr:hypothetical protein [Micromonosporaceae bacterium]